MALTGCAASVSRPTATTAQARIAAPAATSKLFVVLVPGADLPKTDANWEALREEWQTSLASAAAAQQVDVALLPREPQTIAPSTVLARVTVNDYRYVSQAKRYGLGVMAGNAYMDLDVEFFSAPGKQSIGTRKFSTSSSAWQGVFSAMTPKQVEAVASEIVKEVAQK
ncbi:hypothetical protein ASF43_01330 [Pseudorhodoferax sp. Leaf267]|nr:hypothetical protein ASF43_01330 [Pseudorhodoferax sp. Leaf267]